MKKILFLVLVSCFLNSCSSDSGTPSTSDTDNILIRKIISTSPSGMGSSNTYATTYTYNGKKLVTANSNNDAVFQYYYTGDLITSIKFYFRGALQATTTFQYDGSNRLILWTEYVGAPETRINREREFHHNTDGTITVDGRIFDSSENEFSPINTEKYFLNSNDEVERVEILSPNGTQVIQYTYDDKHNLFKNVIGFKEINKLFVEGNDANIISIIFSGYDPGNNNESAEVRTYTYNTEDFPITGVRFHPNDVNSIVITDQYIYE